MVFENCETNNNQLTLPNSPISPFSPFSNLDSFDFEFKPNFFHDENATFDYSPQIHHLISETPNDHFQNEIEYQNQFGILKQVETQNLIETQKQFDILNLIENQKQFDILNQIQFQTQSQNQFPTQFQNQIENQTQSPIETQTQFQNQNQNQIQSKNQNSSSPKNYSKKSKNYRKKSKNYRKKSKNATQNKFTNNNSSCKKTGANTNPCHSHINMKFHAFILKFFDIDLCKKAWENISHILDGFNSEFQFPNIDDLFEILTDSQIHHFQFESQELLYQDYQEINFEKIKLVFHFIIELVKKFESLNNFQILNYGSLFNPDIQMKLCSQSYVYVLGSAFLYKLNRSCLSDPEKLAMNNYYQTGLPFIYYFASNSNYRNMSIKIKAPNKDTKVMTNHFGFNLFYSLFINMFSSLLKNESWTDIEHCPYCSFTPSLSIRPNGKKNSLNKHHEKCPGNSFRKKDLNLFPQDSVWLNSEVYKYLKY